MGTMGCKFEWKESYPVFYSSPTFNSIWRWFFFNSPSTSNILSKLSQKQTWLPVMRKVSFTRYGGAEFLFMMLFRFFRACNIEYLWRNRHVPFHTLHLFPPLTFSRFFPCGRFFNWPLKETGVIASIQCALGGPQLENFGFLELSSFIHAPSFLHFHVS